MQCLYLYHLLTHIFLMSSMQRLFVSNKTCLYPACIPRLTLVINRVDILLEDINQGFREDVEEGFAQYFGCTGWTFEVRVSGACEDFEGGHYGLVKD